MSFQLGFLQKFIGKDNIPGILGNIRYFVHNTQETEKYPTGDRAQAKFEAELTIELCKHLLFNNLQPTQIQIMTNSPRRLQLIDKKMNNLLNFVCRLIPHHLTDQEVKMSGNRVTILVLVKTEEGWTEELMARSIWKAIHSASDGIIVISHFSVILKPSSEMWRSVVDSLYRMGSLSPYIPLHCALHRKTLLNIQSAEHIRLASPKGGCLDICDKKKCGHRCLYVCHPQNQAHNAPPYVCQFLCTLTCLNGHPCLSICGDQCRCEQGCGFLRPCGHPVDTGSNRVCPEVCGIALPCSHICDLPCHLLENPTHEGVACEQPCIRQCARGAHYCRGPRAHPCNTPCPPCHRSYSLPLDCGHELRPRCSDEPPDLARYVCTMPCKRLYPLCAHRCLKQCHEDCGTCEDLYPRRHPKCGHIVMAKCHTIINWPCLELMDPAYESKCGHKFPIYCSRRTIPPEMVAEYCFRPCTSNVVFVENDCGHECPGTCFDCFQGRFHLRCKKPCEKLLICGHQCLVPCSALCPPCTQKCETGCDHYQCPYECGAPCEHNCLEPCTYKCPHSQCTKLCGEICDWEGCEEPCPKLLPCGHPCVGFCGEKCPPLCRICHHDHLLEGIFSGDSQVAESDRFIFLACGHTIRNECLEGWLTRSTESNEIKSSRCPICPKAIKGLRRFSRVLIPNHKEVEQVKEVLYGKMANIEAEATALKNKILTRFKTPPVYFRDFGSTLLDHLKIPLRSKRVGDRTFNSLYIRKVEFGKWMYQIWETVETQTEEATAQWPPHCVESFKTLFLQLFLMLCRRSWPMHINEVSSISRELARMKDAHALYSRLSTSIEEPVLRLANSPVGTQRFREAEAVIKEWVPYTTAVRNRFETAFSAFMAVQRYTLDLSEQEKQDIVQAFGTRAGRWFKCPNGHVYVVTECGGVTEMGRCNECGETIGGEHHRVLPGNQLAMEMDGAQEPMYPTALNGPPPADN